ncbi:HdeD family acid-resistance protein [Cellulosimicrobium arenosum]|uniref:DUF308 domain-containing protein n=1 Tax=Cellulosimicrobium arenosum TaxID=2708133 RepID=A0A927J1A2_9MICO|nr:DUF308 domain-containing protein [Cellulosimicrobium arenosum]MBD8080048.1 DUF308 domain-containing protein [Cellulosimicrobium arenosum]
MAQDGKMSDRTLGTARKLWGLVYVRGAAYLGVGAALFWVPDEGLTWLRWLVGLVIAAQGALLIVEGRPGEEDRGEVLSWRFVAGIVSVVAGILIVAWPSMTGPLLLTVVGIWACLAAVIGVVGALRERSSHAVAWDWHLVNAALWFVLGVGMLTRPTDDITTSAMLIGLYLLVSGLVLLVGGFSTSTRLRDERAAASAAPADTLAPPPEPGLP